MPEIVTAGPIETPLAGANDIYGRMTNPGAGQFARSSLEDAPTAFLGRAAERGTVQGSSYFDRWLSSLSETPEAGAAGLMSPTATVSPQLTPEQYNPLYAPRDVNGQVVPIGDKPMPEALAQIIGRQKSEEMQRNSVLSRYAATHSMVGTFALGAVSSMLDPLNAATAFLPGIGEGALAARLGTGVAATTTARLLSGAATGAALQAPVSALKLGLSPEEAGDYGLRDAMRDLAFGSAGMAVLHAGIGGAGDLLGRFGADARQAAMKSAIGQMTDGRPVDVQPVVSAAAPAPELSAEPVPRAVPANTPEFLVARQRVQDIEASLPKRPPDILDFLRDSGGLQDQGGELTAMDLDKTRPRFQRRLVRDDGMPLDHARELAEEAGYLPEGSTISDLLEAVRNTSLGDPVFVPEEAASWREAVSHRDAAAADLERLDPRNQIAGPEPVAAGSPSQRQPVPIGGPDYVREQMANDWATGQRLGIIDEVERLSAEQKTAAEIARELGPKLDPARETAKVNGQMGDPGPRLVRNIRSQLGIPSMDQRAEYEQWLAKYREGSPDAPPAGEVVAKPDAELTPRERIARAERSLNTNYLGETVSAENHTGFGPGAPPKSEGLAGVTDAEFSDVAPHWMDPAQLFGEVASDQGALNRDGWAPGMSRDEFAAANDVVYGRHPKPAGDASAQPSAPASIEAAPEAPAARGVGRSPEEADLAAAEQRLTQIPEDSLAPEDKAELAQTAGELDRAETRGQAYDAAASCLTGKI